jgi:hypothetical protein
MAASIETAKELDQAEKESTTQAATEPQAEEKKEGEGGWGAYKV